MSTNVVDLSGQYPYLAKGQLSSVQGLVVHHTATPDTATPQSIAQGWKQTGTSSQYIMGRDGTIYQMMPDGSKAYQIVKSWNPAIPWASNSTTVGIELIAKDDQDVTPAQTAALQQFALEQAQKYGFDPATNVVGHGEVNGSGAPPGTNPMYLRQDSEGMTAVNNLRSYLKANPAIEQEYAPATAVAAAASEAGASNASALAYVPPPSRLNTSAKLDNIKAQVAARQIALDSAASFGVRVPPGAPPPKAGDFVSGDFNQFGDAMNVLAPGIGALSDPRTSALLNGNTADPIGDGPVSWFGTPDMAPAGIGAPATAHADIAPVPMPGRPSSMDAVTKPEPGTPATNFDTVLPPKQEAAYQTWKAKVAPNDSGADYDFRGAFAAGVKPLDSSDPAQDGHWPDTFKKPSEPTFSVESQYAKFAPSLAGHWEGDTYVPPAVSLEDRDALYAAKQAAIAVEAPVPMPGRPASLDAQPAAAAPPAQPAQIVHVGKNDYTVGDRFTQGGYNYEVTPKGIEKIGKVSTGQPNLLDSIGGKMVADIVTKAADAGASQVGKVAGDAGAAITKNASQIGDKVTTGVKAVPGLVVGVSNAIGNLFAGFGAKPSTADKLSAVIATGYAGEHFPVYEPAPAVVPTPARWGWSDVPAAPPPPPKLPAIVTAPVAPAVVPLTVDETRQEQTQARKLVPTTVSTATVKPPTGSVPTAPAPASTAVAPVFSGPVASRPAGAPQTKVIHVPNPEYSQWVSQQSVAPAIAGRVVGGDTRDLSDTPAAAPLDATAAPPEFIPKIVPVTPPTPIAGRYTLQPGDTLSDVARRSGVSVSQIAADNGISDVNKIMAGSSIIVGSQSSIPVSAPSSRNSSAQQAALQATAPTVQIASGKSAAVGSVSTSQDGRYSYQVQANGSILNTTTGRITSPATR